MIVELLYVEGCPNVDVARARLGEAAKSVATEIEVRERRVADGTEASALGMPGSPTILVDGVDVVVGGATPPSMSCRLYRSGEHVDGAPSADVLTRALARGVHRADER